MRKRNLFLYIFIFLFSCTSDQYQYSNIDYLSLKKPTQYIELPEELDEISGLEYFGKDKLICINDEIGTVYIIDVNTTEIIQQINFKEKGDFEGIASDREMIYVITSDGLLYEINFHKNLKPNKYHIDIDGEEIESLSFHDGLIYTMTKRLKGTQEIIVYTLDPQNLNEPPKAAFSIKLESIKEFLAKDEEESILKEFTKFISGDDIYNFIRPSGITFDQKSGHMLILSHHNRFLLEVDKEGTLYNISSLTSEKFYQPEGITLDADGNLFISNEARGHRPNILKFESFK